eukprot:TRINITY_DN27996_c0_g1_i1.p1 TRINITY_DN27996_c0_g1~~TRINITY_DN27996_c0_g1_i1.p1  ORF type:complete len:252 (-),score=66.33 TRINITY_DN27996_c0_g1_i1:190-945(-)
MAKSSKKSVRWSPGAVCVRSMATENEHNFEVSVAALNVDWTNRKPPINVERNFLAKFKSLTLDTLAAPNFVSVSEISGKHFPKKLHAELADRGYGLTWSKPAYDWLATYAHGWAQMPNSDEIVSNVGKYVGKLLVNDSGNCTVLHLSVHLPSKIRKQLAWNALVQFVDEAPSKYELDGIIVAGDFNTSANEIQRYLSMATAIPHGTVTTEENGQDDNIAFSDYFTTKSFTVHKAENSFKHHPIHATLTAER